MKTKINPIIGTVVGGSLLYNAYCQGFNTGWERRGRIKTPVFPTTYDPPATPLKVYLEGPQS